MAQKTTSTTLVPMVRQFDPYTAPSPYAAAPILVDPSAVVALVAEGWQVAPAAGSAGDA